LVKDISMIVHLQFGFSQFISFREEDLWNFSQSEHIIFLVHLDQRSRWTIAITWNPSSVNFSHFKLLLRNHRADWNQT
jgi:hypothetical protein